MGKSLQADDTSRFIAFTDLGLSPVALHTRQFDLRWYSLAYLAGIFVGYWYLLRLIKQPGAPLARRHADDLVFYAALGIILGGRFGYVLFYDLGQYLATDRNPEAVGRRHVVPRRSDRNLARHLLFRAQGETVVAADPRLCRLLRALRPVLRPAGQFREPGVVGRATSRRGRALRGDNALSAASSVRRATRARSTRRTSRVSSSSRSCGGCSGKPTRDTSRASSSARSCFSTACSASASSSSASPTATGRVRPGDGAAHGPVAVAADDPRRPLPDADRARAAGPRRADGGHRERRVTPLERALRDAHPGRGADHRRSVYGKPATLIITRRAIRSAPRRFHHCAGDQPDVRRDDRRGAGRLWTRAGAPADAIYVELGPGRGTLAADALRVLRRGGLLGRVHFVETSPSCARRRRSRCRSEMARIDRGLPARADAAGRERIPRRLADPAIRRRVERRVSVAAEDSRSIATVRSSSFTGS